MNHSAAGGLDISSKKQQDNVTCQEMPGTIFEKDKYVYEFPKTVEEALTKDKKNRNTLYADTITKDMKIG